MSEHVVPQEDRLELPVEWQRLALPRRSNGVRHSIELDAKASERYAERLRSAPEALQRAADHPHTDKELVYRGTAHMERAPDPLGAAVIAELLDRLHDVDRASGSSPRSPLRGNALRRNHIEAWHEEFGLPFAVSAAIEQLSLRSAGLPTSTDAFHLAQSAPGSGRWLNWINRGLLGLLRQLIAVAPAEEYERVVAAAAFHRDTLHKRHAAAVLLPDQTEWATEILSETPPFAGTVALERLNWTLVSSGDHIALRRKTINPTTFHPGSVADLLANLGGACLPVLAETLQFRHLAQEFRAAVLQGIALLPTDDAFRLLLDNLDEGDSIEATEAAAARFPARASRIVIARAATAAPAARPRLFALLKWHHVDHHEVPQVPDEARTEGTAVPAAALPEAPLESLPKVLVGPPWAEKRKSKAPKEIPGLHVPDPQIVGRTGDFEQALALEPNLAEWDPDESFWDDAEYSSYNTGWRPAESVLSQLAHKGPSVADEAAEGLRETPWHGRGLQPIRSARAAAIAAHWFLRLKDGRGPGLDWFDRHGLHAVPLLMPEAFGPKSYQRTTARGALRLLAWRYGTEKVLAAIEPLGPAAVDGLAAVIADPHRPLLNTPSPGWWAKPDRLPVVLTADRRAVLPGQAVRHLIEALSQWAPRVPCPAAEAAVAACDRDSLARFSLALAERWIDAGVPNDDDWAIFQLALFGTAEAADLLEARIPRWGGRQPGLTHVGLETLAAFPAKTAFAPLYRLSRGKMKPHYKKLAAEQCATVATRLGAEPEPLADRFAPTLGLDDPATMTLDFGSRAFHIKVDERLNLSVTDAAGKTRARLPRPGVRDDAEVAAASIARFRKLTKDLAAEVAFQSARLEDAMIDGRLWTLEEFARFTANPILASLARGLLWIGRTSAAAQCFRLAEDGSIADLDDKPLELMEGSLVRLAHPIWLGNDRDAWTGVFSDYEILQPFDQLARPSLGFTQDEAENGVLLRFTGATATIGGLREVMDLEGVNAISPNGNVQYLNLLARELPDGVRLMAEVDPDPASHDPDPADRHRVQSIWFSTTKNRNPGVPTLNGQDLLDAVDPVLVSEIIAGLGRATGIHH
jgi:hypothetical protein